MRNLNRLTAQALVDALASGKTTSIQATEAALDRIGQVDHSIHAFLHVDAEGALATAEAVDQDRAKGKPLPPLAGIPVGVKDVLVTKDCPTTAGSRILEGWIPPYDSTVVERLRAARMPIVGKTNMDEFAMGSSTEHSGYGPTRNPWDLDRIPGGSGGGSAAAIAAFEVPLAIGSDTGGSIRQPAAVTGTVGVKPTYGAVSRYGVIALASSLDQVGPCARTVQDSALLYEVIAGHDPKDTTSLPDAVPSVVQAAKRGREEGLDGIRIGIIKELTGKGFQKGVRQRFDEAVHHLTSLGATVTTVSCPSFDYALAAYYLILPSEASSNLARYDSVRFGLRVDEGGTVERVMGATRAKGFGDEVKRRIILGTYALSAGYYDAYYGSAQKVRTLIQRDLAEAFGSVDVLISPTCPTTAFKLGEQVDDPLTMYLNDIATIPANLAGIPGMSLPVGLAPEDGLPVGLQILAPAKADDRLYRVGAALESALVDLWSGTLLTQAPDLEEAT